jgi:hypothetical protein
MTENWEKRKISDDFRQLRQPISDYIRPALKKQWLRQWISDYTRPIFDR